MCSLHLKICSAFYWLFCIMDLINARKMEHTSIKSGNEPSGSIKCGEFLD